MKILYTTGDALWLSENGKAVELPSYRAMKYQETIEEIRQNKAWKTTGRGARFMETDEPQETGDVKAAFCGIAPHGDGFLYTLALDGSGGMYERSLSEKAEMEGHICSGSDIRLGEIACHENEVAACIRYANGRSHIGIYHLPQSSCDEITEGDSVESAPSWSPDGRTLYFSTCGIARGSSGDPAAYSPVSAVAYNPAAGRMETLLESEKYDYLAPKADSAGNLWCIRQPYRTGEESNGNILLDIVLFPVRIIKAIGGFLNAFSILFGGESLRSGKRSGNVKTKQRSEKDLFFEGNIIHAEKNQKANARSGEKFPGILPRSRVLLCIRPDGTEQIAAHGVLDYCLCPEGVVCSNGSHILLYTPDGKAEDLGKAKLAARLAVLPD